LLLVVLGLQWVLRLQRHQLNHLYQTRQVHQLTQLLLHLLEHLESRKTLEHLEILEVQLLLVHLMIQMLPEDHSLRLVRLVRPHPGLQLIQDYQIFLKHQLYLALQVVH